MRAEREAVARRHRSQGQEEAEKLRATADYEVTRTLAEAERQGRISRGEGDAEAAKLFADAFSQDPDFYAFIRSLRAYEKSFEGNQDVMIMSPDSDFFRYMKTRIRQHVKIVSTVLDEQNHRHPQGGGGFLFI
ncbi:FtsH protease regulator HflC [Citrobacter koseri]|uniref:FtsH protease regulator HflC n=1 Tax=Citrobacter koseri TaxID=545 RepID=A0A3S4IWS9_CITKO|nr:FtsH protease regulator HflC [Citrobacter koseri]